MPDLNTIDELDAELNNVFDNDEDDVQETDTINEKDETEEENLESLESIMSKTETKTEKKSDKTDTGVNNSKQITKQQSNKQSGNNNSQDLVDKDGNIIAKAGAERRFYEENVKLKRERDTFRTQVLPTLQQNYNAMKQKVEAYEQAMKSFQVNDLNADEINTGIELIRSWKKSPQDTIKMLLTQAKSYGINIDSDKSGIDMQAINTMLDQKLQPFLQERENRLNNYKMQQETENIYRNFMNRYPDAVNHKQELAFLLRKNPNLSLDAVYYQLKSHYAEKGYDFNTPLAEILKNNAQNAQNKSSFNMMNTNQNIKTTNINNKTASLNESYANIIKSVINDVKSKK